MSPSSSAAAKTERLLNLVICLLYTRRPLSKARIYEAVPQYKQTASMDAFDRMFERDKDELRDLGIPLRTEPLDPFFDDEPGYRIDRREYALPEVSFAPDELAVLGLASTVWAQASLAGAAAQAMRKLAAADVERDDASIIGLEPRVRTVEPAFEPVRRAVLDARPIRFPYRASGQGEAADRHVQPWGIASWHGRWYLTGYDIDRQAPRVFRLGRIDGPVQTDGKAGAYQVPPDHDAREMIGRLVQVGEPHPAVLRVRRGTGHALRRRARTVAEIDDKWSQLDIDFGDVDIFADEIAGFGADVVVLHPPEVADEVLRRLRGALAASQVQAAPQPPAQAAR